MEPLFSQLHGDGIHDDTNTLQAILDHANDVIYIKNGIYLITRPLVVHDNTRLVLSNNAVMRLADGANCAIMENDKLPSRGTNHNITIEGGIWDGNNQNQVRRSRESRFALTHYEEDYYYGIFMRFVGVRDLHLRDMTIKNPESYGMLISNIEQFTVEHITFDYNMLRTNMDGVHVQGVARNGIIRDIKGATNDDLVALNCDDIYACEITRGVIENILVDGLYSDDGYTAVRLLSCGSEMRNISIRNIFGSYRYYGVSFTHHSVHPGEPVWFDNVSVNGVYCSKSPQCEPNNNEPIIWFAEGARCGRVSLSDIHRLEYASTKAPTIRVDSDVSIQRLVIRDVSQHFPNGHTQPLFVNNGDITNLKCSDIDE
ncbi:MAG TPA: hypothetical protein DEB10_02020 [Ruminococcaceae bacterium]|nr:hypothetical protein [Oscillospiraceae bacterium]